MSFSTFCNPFYHPSITTVQIILRIITLLLSISCLSVTIYLSVNFSLTYLTVYIALMLSIVVSQTSIIKLISKPSHSSFCAEHGILVGLEALVLVYWVIVFVLVKLGRGIPESADIRWIMSGRGGARCTRILQGLIIGIM